MTRPQTKEEKIDFLRKNIAKEDFVKTNIEQDLDLSVDILRFKEHLDGNENVVKHRELDKKYDGLDLTQRFLDFKKNDDEDYISKKSKLSFAAKTGLVVSAGLVATAFAVASPALVSTIGLSTVIPNLSSVGFGIFAAGALSFGSSIGLNNYANKLSEEREFNISSEYGDNGLERINKSIRSNIDENHVSQEKIQERLNNNEEYQQKASEHFNKLEEIKSSKQNSEIASMVRRNGVDNPFALTLGRVFHLAYDIYVDYKKDKLSNQFDEYHSEMYSKYKDKINQEMKLEEKNEQDFDIEESLKAFNENKVGQPISKLQDSIAESMVAKNEVVRDSLDFESNKPEKNEGLENVEVENEFLNKLKKLNKNGYQKLAEGRSEMKQTLENETQVQSISEPRNEQRLTNGKQNKY